MNGWASRFPAASSIKHHNDPSSKQQDRGAQVDIFRETDIINGTTRNSLRSRWPLLGPIKGLKNLFRVIGQAKNEFPTKPPRVSSKPIGSIRSIRDQPCIHDEQKSEPAYAKWRSERRR